MQEGWQGRLSLRVDATPVQTLSAAFDLRGDPAEGELTLTGPLGTMVAQARWAPGSVEWHTTNETRSFPSLDAMAVQLTGTALPMAALFERNLYQRSASPESLLAYDLAALQPQFQRRMLSLHSPTPPSALF